MLRIPKTPAPRKRTNPSGKTAWIARYPARDGTYPSAGTRRRKSDAETLIREAMEREWSNTTTDTFGAYLPSWLARHPRSDRTNRTNEHRIKTQLGVEIEGVPVRDWVMADWRPRHTIELVDIMLREQERSYNGVAGIKNAYSAMCEGALTEEIIEANPFRGVKLRRDDPRIKTPPRKIRVWRIEQMREFAACAGTHEPLVRLVSDCFLRVSEALAAYKADFDVESGTLWVRRTVDDRARELRGTKTTHNVERDEDLGRTVVLPDGLAEMLWAMDWHTASKFLFPTGNGRPWILSNFYRQVWRPAQRRWAERLGVEFPRRIPRRELAQMLEASGYDPRPHELRHSMITHLAAAGVDIADLAQMSGHSVETLNAIYRHPTNASHSRVKELLA